MPKKRKSNYWTHTKHYGRNKARKITEDFSVSEIQSCDNEENEYMSHTIIRGSYGQNDKKFSSESRNKQCLAIAVVALAYSNLMCFSCWNTVIIDNILNYGDRLYRICTTLRKSSALEELFVYRRFKIGNVFYSLKINENDKVTGHRLQTDGKMDPAFDEGLQRIFENYRTVLFSYGSLSICVGRTSISFYLFDSCGHGKNREASEDVGKAFLIRFPVIDRLKDYLCRNYSSAHHYSLLPINVKIGSVDNLPQQPPCLKTVCEAIELMYGVIEWF